MHLTRPPQPSRHPIAGDGGFTLPTVMLALVVLTALVVAAFAAVQGDMNLGARTRTAKQATFAAQSGSAYYVDLLRQDAEAWRSCATLPADADGRPKPVNQLWDGKGADPRVWRVVPGDPKSRYTVEVVSNAQKGYTGCADTNAQSYIRDDGTIVVRTTGQSGLPGVDPVTGAVTGTGSTTGRQVETRSFVTTLRRKSFLDFIYFTDKETSDPLQILMGASQDLRDTELRRNANDPATTETLTSWAASDKPADNGCDRYWDTGTAATSRKNARYPGWYRMPGRAWAYNPTNQQLPTCQAIRFADTDAVRGPVHTNDTAQLCGSPTFGRTGSVDSIEMKWIAMAGCSASPRFGTSRNITDAPSLALPSTNATLKQETLPGFMFTGSTTITLSGATVSINGGPATALPANGLIYVRNNPGASCPTSDPLDPVEVTPACGDAFVSGTSSKDLTINAERDVRVTGDIRSADDAMLGLIANNFVRVQHKVTNQASCLTNPTGVGSVRAGSDITIDAAILALQHVFTVDDYNCGTEMGHLYVNGAIAQKYRGPVGTAYSTGAQTGYTKDYRYDERLAYRAPPHFLSPLESGWRVVRSVEQADAANQ